MANIRVLTWNLWWRRGPWRQRYASVLEILRDERPYICGLQEAWADAHENIVESLARKLDMNWTWVPSPAPGRWQERIGDPTVVAGNAVLSRWPIIDKDHLQPPTGDSPNEGRTAMFTLIAAPWCNIPFFTTHLNSTVRQSEIWCAQVRSLAEFVVAHRSDKFPPVVTGDFNAEPNSDEVRLMGGRKTAPAAPGPLLLDSWQYADPTSDHLTWNRTNPFAAQHWAPSARIDYIFVGQPLPSRAGLIKSVHLAGDTAVNGVWPSDHAGALDELESGTD